MAIKEQLWIVMIFDGVRERFNVTGIIYTLKSPHSDKMYMNIFDYQWSPSENRS